MVIGLIAGYLTITGVDLFTNAVLNAQPIAPLQRLVLILDPSYVDAAELTGDQRTTILVRLILYGVAFTIFIGMLADSLGVVYWETWIGQAINQHLRVKMIENAEHLSLRYQSHARTGDAIYRVFQDSRMISNIIASIILDPLEQGAGLLGAFVIIWFSARSSGPSSRSRSYRSCSSSCGGRRASSGCRGCPASRTATSPRVSRRWPRACAC